MAKDPIRGNPSEFGNLEELFCRIKIQTEDLESDLRSIALGTSQNFRGEAADAFSKNLTDLAPALREVPDIARRVERIFCDHKNQLIRLRQAADSAVARAETNWNEQRRADAIHDDATGDLWRVRLQLLATWDDADRTRLECRKVDLQDDVAVASRRLNRANDNVEHSEEELKNLTNEEEELNERTANELERVDVGVLADPGWLERLAGFFVDVVQLAAFGGAALLLFVLPTEILQWIYDRLEDVIFWATVAAYALLVVAVVVGVVLAPFTGGASLSLVALGWSAASFILNVTFALSVVKFAIGVELYKRKTLYGDDKVTLSGQDVLLDGLCVALSGAGKGLVKLGTKIGGRAGGVVVGSADEVSDGITLLDGLADRTTDDIAQDDWTVCTAEMPQQPGYVSVDQISDVVIPSYDGPESVSGIDQITMPGFVTTAQTSMPPIRVVSVGPFVTADFDIRLSGSADFSISDFGEAVGDFGDFDVDIPMIALEFDSHFSFDPPSVIFEDFRRAFDQNLRPLMVPCGLEN